MAQLFIAVPKNAWLITPLSGDSFELRGDSAAPVRRTEDPIGTRAALYILRIGTGSNPDWTLLNMQSSIRIRINGERPLFALYVLRHQDEIMLDESVRAYFSTERLSRVELFPGGEKPVHCPRCHQVIQRGAASVQCPRCDVWHHQVDEVLPCWTYAEKCAVCDQPTPLDGVYQWVPEGV